MTDLLSPYLETLRAAASRASRVPDEAEDLLQDALLEAIRAGRTDLSQAANQRWLLGTIRNLGVMTARGAVRRRRREGVYSAEHASFAETAPPVSADTPPALRPWLDSLPPSLRRVADLALAGHDRQEIGWLLDIGQATLRQRIAGLRKRLAECEAGPFDLDASSGSLAERSLRLGLIRRALLPVVVARQAVGAHDPDGHLLLFSRRVGRPG